MTADKPVLIHVDDDETNRYAVKRILERSNYKVLSAETGAAGLELIYSSNPDLIILDIQLPDVDGRELCKKLKLDSKFNKIPILQMSANFTKPEDTVAGLESGADGYLVQPIDAPVLVATIKSLLRLRKAEQEAERSNLAKSLFLANMSHEIRTPLGAIMGFTELLKEELTNPRQSTYLTIIERNSLQLMNVINDILDLSKVEAGHIAIESVTTNIREFILSLKDIWDLAAKKNKTEVEITFSDELPSHLSLDQTRLRQILINIVGNAIKFTSGGHVRMEVRLLDKAFLTFVVTDTGIGISPAQGEKLFQPFSQADSSTTRVYGGTGLGLVLSRHLARAMGGDIKLLESQLQIGSSFEIKIKTTVMDQSKSAPLSHVDAYEGTFGIQGLRTLLVDDSPDNQDLINIFLNKEGIKPDIASNGKEAVELSLKNNYDVILMDIQMPLMDGYQATTELRKEGVKTPIIALTAHAMAEERLRCLKVGFTDYVSKPIDRDKLYRSIKIHTARVNLN